MKCNRNLQALLFCYVTKTEIDEIEHPLCSVWLLCDGLSGPGCGSALRRANPHCRRPPRFRRRRLSRRAGTFPGRGWLKAFTADDVQPTLKLALDLLFSEAAAFSGNAGYTFTLGDNLVNQFFTYASLGVGFPGLDGLGVYGGRYLLFPRSGDIGNGLDGGFVYLLGTATQLDLNLGFGLTQDEPDVFVGAGIARRF